MMMMDAYQDRQDDQWRQTREVAYMIYCSASEANGRATIYEFMPLKGDPTKAERAAAKKRELKKRAERHKATMEDLVKRGVIKPRKKANG